MYNPPAFPKPYVPGNTQQDGMSMRDWFAGQVAPAIATWHAVDRGGYVGVAEKAYALADALLQVGARDR